MKLRLFVAAALAVTLFNCKNDSKTDAKTKGDSTAVSSDKGGSDDEAGTDDEVLTDKAPAVEDGKVLLRLHYNKGFEQELSYAVVTKAEGMNANINMSMVMKVVSVREGANPVYGFNGEITGMKMDSEAMGQKIKYDSSKKVSAMTEQEKMMDKQLSGVINQPITFSLDSKSKMVGKMEFKSKDGKVQDQPFDINNYQMAFPEKAVGVGESWTNEVESKQMGGAKIKSTYTIKEIKDDVVIIGLKSVVPPVGGSKEPTALTGEYTLDRATGMVLKGSMQGKMAMMGATLSMTFTGKKIK